MKLNIKKAATAALVGIAAFGANAQDNQSGYFVENYAYRFLMNPAIGNDSSKLFVAIPAIGNINAEMRGNLSLKDVIYNVNGKTTTFLNPNISASEVMGNLSDMNRLGFDTRINILSFGFRAFGGYNTINLSARASVHARLPKAIFSFLKEGVTNKNYEIDGLKARAIGYGEISLGHSRRITPEWRVGANLKFLVGIGSVDANLARASVNLGHDSWDIVTNADITTSLKGMHYKTDINSHTNMEYVNGLDGDFSAPNGFGMAVDLGAVYSPKALSDWEFSLALTDLGFINWSESILASTNGDKAFKSDIYTFSPDDDASNSFSSEWKQMRNSLESLYQLENDGPQGSRMETLHATLNVGAQYTFPLYRKLSFGLLNTTRIAGDFSWTDFRLSANYAPVKYVSLSVNGTAGTLGCGFGWLANLRIPYANINLFVAQDNFFAKMAKQGVPLQSNASVSAGLNVYL